MVWGKTASSHLPSSWQRSLCAKQCAEQCAESCARLSWDDTTLINGAVIKSGDMKVCPERSSSSGLCYYTNYDNLKVCCGGTDLNLVSATLKVGSEDVPAEILYAGGLGRRPELCVNFNRNDIKLCPPRGECPPEKCIEPPQLCTNNSISCDLSACTCKEGYKETDCCKCDESYIRHDGVCSLQCSPNCDNSQCTVCKHPYTDPPLCCNCTEPYVKENEECRCPPGTIEINGTCKTICLNNTVLCNSPSPCCKEGFKAPDCCECIFNKTEEGFSYFKKDDKCNIICTKNAEESKCDVNTGCSECKDSFQPPDCCNCTEPKKLIDGECRCPPGTVEQDDGTCEPICEKNTVPCNSPSPCCKEGFKAPLCCECIFNKTEEGFRYFKKDDECNKICRENAEENKCDVSRGCSECKDSFQPPDCCNCTESKYLVDNVCRDCPSGKVPVNGKCSDICEDNIVPDSCDGTGCTCKDDYAGNDCCICKKNVDGECSETNCPCKPNFASPDCCKCNNEAELVNGVCKVSCFNTQNVFIILDRSSGSSEQEFSYSFFMTHMLAGNMLRSTKDVTVTVLAYAEDKDSEALPELVPATSSGPTLTDQSCVSKLRAAENKMFTKPRANHTVADKTMELLKDYIQTGVQNTVITFSGIISDHQNNDPFQRIKNAIEEMKKKSAVKFFSVGFEGENSKKERYKNEILALANNKPSQSVTGKDPAPLMRKLTDILVSNGVLCQEQDDAIKRFIEGSANIYTDYRDCQTNNRRARYNPKNTPPLCIDQNPTYGDICRKAPTVKSFLLAMMNRLLMLSK